MYDHYSYVLESFEILEVITRKKHAVENIIFNDYSSNVRRCCCQLPKSTKPRSNHSSEFLE